MSRPDNYGDLKAGDRVGDHNHFGNLTLELYTVERVTPKTIFADGRRWKREDGWLIQDKRQAFGQPRLEFPEYIREMRALHLANEIRQRLDKKRFSLNTLLDVSLILDQAEIIEQGGMR